MQTHRHTDTGINNMTRPGLGAGPSEIKKKKLQWAIENGKMSMEKLHLTIVNWSLDNRL